MCHEKFVTKCHLDAYRLNLDLISLLVCTKQLLDTDIVCSVTSCAGTIFFHRKIMCVQWMSSCAGLRACLRFVGGIILLKCSPVPRACLPSSLSHCSFSLILCREGVPENETGREDWYLLNQILGGGDPLWSTSKFTASTFIWSSVTRPVSASLSVIVCVRRGRLNEREEALEAIVKGLPYFLVSLSFTLRCHYFCAPLRKTGTGRWCWHVVYVFVILCFERKTYCYSANSGAQSELAPLFNTQSSGHKQRKDYTHWHKPPSKACVTHLHSEKKALYPLHDV